VRQAVKVHQGYRAALRVREGQRSPVLGVLQGRSGVKGDHRHRVPLRAIVTWVRGV